MVLTLRFCTLTDDEEDEESFEFIDEVNAMSSNAEPLERLETYFSRPLSIFSSSSSSSRNILRRLAMVSSRFERLAVLYKVKNVRI